MSEWIPVSERLPEKGKEPVLFYKKEIGIDIGYLVIEDTLMFDGIGVGWVHATHWMPLPAPPEVE